MANRVDMGGLNDYQGSSHSSDTNPFGKSAARFNATSARSASRKRQKVSSQLEKDTTAVLKPEPMDQAVDVDRLAAIAAADETVYIEDVERPGAAAVLSEVSRRARGKEGINLDNAKGLPERLGDKPLRLVIGGNNPSDHAW